ncbi:MAG: metal-dependent transcriptional regulator [Bacteroides sp.]
MSGIAIICIAVLLLLSYLWLQHVRRARHLPHQTPHLATKKKISSAIQAEEDLLKYLYQNPVLAKKLGDSTNSHNVLPPYLNHLVHILVAKGYLAPQTLQFTALGTRTAQKLLRRHRLYETYLCERTGIPPNEWHDIAERMEHHLDDEDTEKLARKLGFPLLDPHGDIIETEHVLNKTLVQPLSQVDNLNEWWQIVHIDDKQKEAHHWLNKEGFYLGAKLQLQARDNDCISVTLDGSPIEIKISTASTLLVTQTTPQPKGMLRLSQLPTKKEAIIYGIAGSCYGSNRRRLLDLGFIEGARVSVCFRSPLGNPTAYQIRGTIIALRADQARQIQVIQEDSAKNDDL